MIKKLVIEIEVPFPELLGCVSYRMFLDHSVAIDEGDTKMAELLRENFYKPSGSYTNDGRRKLLWTRNFPYFGDRTTKELEDGDEEKETR